MNNVAEEEVIYQVKEDVISNSNNNQVLTWKTEIKRLGLDVTKINI